MEHLTSNARPIPLPVITFWSTVGLFCAGGLLLNILAKSIGYAVIAAYIGLWFCCSWAAVLSFVLTIVCFRRKTCSGIQLIIQIPIALYCVYVLSQFFNMAI